MRTFQSRTLTTLQHSGQRSPEFRAVYSRRILLRAAKATASASWGETTVFVLRTQSKGAADLMEEEQEDNQHDGDVHSDDQDGEEDEDGNQDDGESSHHQHDEM
jgi:hypothetical protein